jgi:hypothetical protein
VTACCSVFFVKLLPLTLEDSEQMASFSVLLYFSNPALIFFHCPLNLHQIHSPPTIQISIDCLPWLYCTTSLNLNLPTDLYNLEPMNWCIPIFTYKFTYLQIATFYLRIHLLIPKNCCIPIQTTFYLRIYLQKVTYQFVQCCTYEFIYNHELSACYFQHMPSCG